ncbi:MAG TPA: BatA domain-containing protein, partial [Gemmataceae bacterium]|nr:BatA domain-containing protein [Gemmataceae bacterium]
MPFGVLNVLMLAGLAGVAIPILIHLLNRRRYNVVDWGAMQFLQISETTRRRILIEELLLMLLRMGLIAVLVLALASPYLDSQAFARIAGGGDRDVVLVFDGSYSMGFADKGPSAHDAAKAWATAFVSDLSAGDSVAVLQAKQQVLPVLGTPTHDLQRVRDTIDHLPAPAGGCDWPAAVEAAHKILAQHGRARRDIILLSDNQRFGWADDTTLLRWELLANTLREESEAKRPHVWVVNLAPDRPAAPPNWSLAPVRASRAVASVGQLITFRTALEIRGQEEYGPPHELRVEVDGKPVTTDLRAPAAARLEKGQVPLSFRHRFQTPGTHLVSVLLEPDPPPAERPAGYTVKDHLPGDNRQDYAIEVLPALPVLLVDGDGKADAKQRGSDFLRDALSPARDLTPAVLAKVVPINQFGADDLSGPVGKEPNTRPRVLILSNVARLSEAQQEAVGNFLAGGGGVLVTLGERVEARHYNDELYRGGQGWLPARLEDLAGDLDHPEKAAAPLTSSLFHPAVELFRDVPVGGLGEVRFPRWWKVTTPGRNSGGVPIALLNSTDPLLVEKPYRNGRVILAAVPLDRSWRTNLTDLPAFVPLAHELAYYLGGVRAAEHNLQPGQPIRYRPDSEEGIDALTLQAPQGEPKPLQFANVTDGS